MITVHTLVKNEEKYLWYAVGSVIDYVDKLLLWDTGSTDNTKKIIKQIKKYNPEKVVARYLKEVGINEFSTLRQEMLDETKTDWAMVLDGDEVWWDEKIRESIERIKSVKGLQTLVNRYINPVGDIYHFKDPSRERYMIDGVTGALTIRFMNKRLIQGLNASKPHGQQGYFDFNGNLVQDLGKDKRAWIDGVSYMHFTHLQRSSSRMHDSLVPKRSFKLKYSLGHDFDRDYYYPESFFTLRPGIVDSPWVKRSKKYTFKSTVLTPLRDIKNLIPIKAKSGY